MNLLKSDKKNKILCELNLQYVGSLLQWFSNLRVRQSALYVSLGEESNEVGYEGKGCLNDFQMENELIEK